MAGSIGGEIFRLRGGEKSFLIPKEQSWCEISSGQFRCDVVIIFISWWLRVELVKKKLEGKKQKKKKKKISPRQMTGSSGGPGSKNPGKQVAYEKTRRQLSTSTPKKKKKKKKKKNVRNKPGDQRNVRATGTPQLFLPRCFLAALYMYLRTISAEQLSLVPRYSMMSLSWVSLLSFPFPSIWVVYDDMMMILRSPPRLGLILKKVDEITFGRGGAIFAREVPNLWVGLVGGPSVRTVLIPSAAAGRKKRRENGTISASRASDPFSSPRRSGKAIDADKGMMRCHWLDSTQLGPINILDHQRQ